MHERREYLATALRAQQLLATEVAATNDADVAPAYQSRIAQLQATSVAYRRALNHDAPPPVCDNPDLAAGYYALLEDSARRGDAEFEEFHHVTADSDGVWDYWFHRFAPRFAQLPSLEPLEVIYAKQDDEAEASMLQKQAMQRLRQGEPAAARAPVVDANGRANASGARKTSRAQVLLWAGAGRIMVNRLPYDAYFKDFLLRQHVLRPLMVAGALGRFNIVASVEGGGTSGQAQALCHGIARAVARFDPDVKSALRKEGLLKRDPRMVERKKPGKAKARKSFAWVKR